MIRFGERRPYWRQTKALVLACLLVTFSVVLTLPWFVSELNSDRFLEFPLGYYLIGHGVVLLFIAAVAFFMLKQDSIDRLHGAQEDI